MYMYVMYTLYEQIWEVRKKSGKSCEATMHAHKIRRTHKLNLNTKINTQKHDESEFQFFEMMS